MAKHRGVNKVRKKLGDGRIVTYRYHRASGLRLPDDPNSPEFARALAHAEKGEPRDDGTLGGFIRRYSTSLKFERLAPSTRVEYRRMLLHIEREFGTMPVQALESPRVRGDFLDYQERIGREHPREADNRLTVLSAVLTFAERNGELRLNPLRGFERLHHGTRVDFVWTEGDMALFMKTAPLELQQALILAIHTGQRYGDLIRLRWTDFEDGSIRLMQSKTQMKVGVPCSNALSRMLADMPKSGPYILTRPDGRPWFTARNDKALSKSWREHSRSVGIEELQFRDLRGTAVTLMSEAGMTIPQIVSITGHTFQSANRILQHYASRTKALAQAAIGVWENAEATRFANSLQTRANPAPGGTKDSD